MAEKDKLRTYRSKRDFTTSEEPSGGHQSTPADTGHRPSSDWPCFVVQRHEASSTHFDFRLEVDGVLKSWAVPKGPSTDPTQKRLASPTEDHPLDYADFEGTIPAGSYGAGTVVVWDQGTYRNLTERRGQTVRMDDGLNAGHVKVWLEGDKLTGAYALTRSHMRGKEQWLLVRVDDGAADRGSDPVANRPESVLTGRTNADLRKDQG